MSLQYKSLAIVVGAQGDEIARVAETLKVRLKLILLQTQQILKDLRQQ